EHHLQRAISAQQVFREKKENMVIPVPEAESNVNYYSRLYKGEFKQPKQFIHIQPFNLDNEQPDYDMDSEDETLLNRLNRKMEIKPLQFEIMIDRLEKASSNQLVTLQEAKLLLNEDDYLIKAVYDYWNRKNDEASYEKMLKLRREFSRAITILEMIKRREKTKREYHLGDYGGEILNEVKLNSTEKEMNTTPAALHNGNHHKVQECKVKHAHHSSLKEEVSDVVRQKKKYPKKPKLESVINPPQSTTEPLPVISKSDIKQYDFHSSDEDEFPQFSLASRYPHQYLSQKKKMILMEPVHSEEEQDANIMLVLMDRIGTENDPVLKQIDPDMLNSCSSSSQNIDISSNFSRTNASNKHCGNKLSLSEILSNIRSCRLQCFQPRLLNVQDSDSEECTSRKPGQAVNNKRVSAPSVALLNTSKNGISVTGGITEEQFQTHQQQLVQMQRQQLAQLQQKQQSQHQSQQTYPKAQGSSTSDCMSKTLDSASAHFAASAVVSAPAPNRGEATKEQSASHNINGVVQPTVHLNNVSVVSPVNVHINARTSAPSPTALKLATVAASMDRVPKVTPSSAISSIARENHEPERLGLNGIAETTVAMEVT
ncbi:hypothetical protein Chor_015981, partial [Crotalus horridus]